MENTVIGNPRRSGVKVNRKEINRVDEARIVHRNQKSYKGSYERVPVKHELPHRLFDETTMTRFHVTRDGIHPTAEKLRKHALGIRFQ
jgi:hypothetical protein